MKKYRVMEVVGDEHYVIKTNILKWRDAFSELMKHYSYMKKTIKEYKNYYILQCYIEAYDDAEIEENEFVYDMDIRLLKVVRGFSNDKRNI